MALANIVLENTGTGPAGEITKVFGMGSAEFNAAVASNAAPANTVERNLAQTDFVGFAILCNKNGGICGGNAHARPDLLPDEPNGYTEYLGFGAKYVNPAISALSCFSLIRKSTTLHRCTSTHHSRTLDICQFLSQLFGPG